MHGRNIVVLLALTGLGSAELIASTGYLASIGPAAIRFLDPPKTARPAVLEPVPTLAPPAEPLAGESPPVAKNVVPIKVPAPPEAIVSLIVSNSIGEFISGMRPDSLYVPPSVLVRYFTGRSGLGAGGVSIPVDFRPPVDPLPPIRSSATYEKGP
jgi:hypothetical protein